MSRARLAPVEVPAGVRTVVGSDLGATRLVLVRHGESVCTVEGVVGGVRGCRGLTATGVSQATRLRERLLRTGELRGASALYSSVLPRAVETAAIMAPGVGDGSLEPVQQCDLCELHPGDADGLSWAELSQRYGEPDWDVDPATPLAPHAESWVQFVERAARALVDVARRHPGEQVVVACHGGVVEAAMLALLPAGAGRKRLKLHTANASISEWELGRFGWRPMRFNDAAHLLEPELPMAESRRPQQA